MPMQAEISFEPFGLNEKKIQYLVLDIKISFSLPRDYTWWLAKNRHNVDQVPLPFVIDQDKTYGVTGNKQVWVSQPSTGLDKRQAMLQLCMRAEGELT